MNCPECGNPSLDLDKDGNWTCLACRASGTLDQETCPHCGFLLDGSEQVCPKCGTRLSIVDTVLARPADNLAASWLAEVREKAGDIKSKEELASVKRMQVLRDQDEIRLSMEMEAMREARNKEKMLLAAVLIGGLILLIVIILAVLAFI